MVGMDGMTLTAAILAGGIILIGWRHHRRTQHQLREIGYLK